MIRVAATPAINVRNISDMCLRCKGGITYKYYTGKPLWEFGYGLSYTTFAFEVSSPKMLTVSIDAIVEHDKIYYQTTRLLPLLFRQYEYGYNY